MIAGCGKEGRGRAAAAGDRYLVLVARGVDVCGAWYVWYVWCMARGGGGVEAVERVLATA